MYLALVVWVLVSLSCWCFGVWCFCRFVDFVDLVLLFVLWFGHTLGVASLVRLCLWFAGCFAGFEVWVLCWWCLWCFAGWE